jgi:hypothetical protein
MSKTLSFEISDELFAVFEQIAAKSGTTPEALALQWIARRSSAPRPPLSDEERRAARAQLLRHAGAVDSGNPRSADNEQIDIDLARLYASDLEPEA